MVVREGTTDVQSILYVKTSLISLNPTIFKTNVRLPPDDLVQKLRKVVRKIILRMTSKRVKPVVNKI